MKGASPATPQKVVSLRLELARLLEKMKSIRSNFGAQHPKAIEKLQRIEAVRLELAVARPL
ncbi:MAG: hypothetical protein ABMA01_05970 [Chthoniobacteraceae bacterium]